MVEFLNFNRIMKATFTIKGWHYWPQGEKPRYPHLAQKHKHKFHITVYVPIGDNNNRDIEFEDFANTLYRCVVAMTTKKGDNIGMFVADFEDKSCGDIGDIVVKCIKNMSNRFPALLSVEEIVVEVNEDGAHGEIIKRSIK